ncbi:VOC family protein [Dechloromonas hortensis]|uniref:VOC family protein n=1 Tax=Dechloromonas hortensis TaxID=337779 RepID=UPI001291EE79|nr:VOC family protein [Dechloromonas hortensis]
MQQQIHFITLGVADLARSRAFYKALGWQESSASQEAIAFYQAGSLAFALFQREALAEDANVPPAGSGFAGFTLAHNVESEAAVLALLEEAVAAGATLVRPADKVFWGGFRGYFADPDGFLWEACYNPFVTLEADGSLRLS